MQFVLGVDGGNTKTIVLVARLDGTIMGTGRGPGCDIYRCGEEDALAHLSKVVTVALAQAGAASGDVAAGVFSLAGADWPEDIDFLQDALRSRGLAHSISVVNDAMGALRAGSPDGTGISIVCGTGAATGARSADGRIWHSSWWQRTQGSEELAHRVLEAVYRSELGIDPPTTLTQRALRVFGLASVESILYQLTARHQQRPIGYVGKLSRALIEEAQRGDEVASQIVRQHGSALADYGLAAARKVGLEGNPYPLVLAGSVIRDTQSPLARAIIARVLSVNPTVKPMTSSYESVIGALFLALEQADIIVDAPLIAHVQASLPPTSLFET
jgi:N-acetylglucosamine kinase-like BadF-type ATPase